MLAAAASRLKTPARPTVVRQRERISGKRSVQLRTSSRSSVCFASRPNQGVAVYDTRSKTRIDAIQYHQVVANRSGGGKIKLLDDVGLTIQPNDSWACWAIRRGQIDFDGFDERHAAASSAMCLSTTSICNAISIAEAVRLAMCRRTTSSIAS